MGNIYKYPSYWNSEPQKKHGMKQNHKVLIIWHVMAACYFINTSVCDCAENGRNFQLVDMSHVFDKNTIYWVTEPSLVLNITYNGTLPQQSNVWYQKEQMYAATHGGTHMDAPCHFAKGRWCISDIPLDRLVVPAAVVDISSKVNGNPNIHLTTEMLLEWEGQNGKIPENSLLLIYTGWSQYWPDRLKYTGTLERDVSQLSFPSIKSQAAEWLVSNRSIVGVGIDTMSVDIPKERPGTHVALMENNIYGLENVNNLDKLPSTGSIAHVMPMKLSNASGAPCRLVAQIPQHSAAGASAVNSCTHIITLIAIILITYVYRI